MTIKKFFTSKKLVITGYYPPAEMRGVLVHKGKHYLRVSFTNRVKYAGTTPTTDIPAEDVICVRKMPSPCKKWLFSLIGKRARPKVFKLTKQKR